MKPIQFQIRILEELLRKEIKEKEQRISALEATKNSNEILVVERELAELYLYSDDLKGELSFSK